MRKKNLSTRELNAIAQLLLEGSSNGNIAHGRINEAASKFCVTRKAIRKTWSRAKKQMLADIPIFLQNIKKGTAQFPLKFDKDKLQLIEFSKRGTIRNIATELKVGKSTVGEWIKRGLIRSHSNAIKPALTYEHKISRMKHSLLALKVNANLKVIKFKSMQHIIHIDGKWFYITRTTERYYLVPEETEPHRECQSKNFITKVMFICVVARPLYGSIGKCLFDGKICLFPFTEKVAAHRKSKNREAGTLETKSMQSITKDVTKDVLINKLIPAIKAKWPTGASKDKLIQQDNVPPHIDDSDPEWRKTTSSDGFNIHLVFQPPKSPYTNVNDLGQFRTLQSLQVKTSASTVDELLAAVHNSFEELCHKKLNSVFLSLQGCLKEILVCRGSNKYKIPHIGKNALLRKGTLSTDLEVELELVQSSVDYLIEESAEDGLEELIESVEGMI